jgi:hypothetical protein
MTALAVAWLGGLLVGAGLATAGWNYRHGWRPDHVELAYHNVVLTQSVLTMLDYVDEAEHDAIEADVEDELAADIDVDLEEVMDLVE